MVGLAAGFFVGFLCELCMVFLLSVEGGFWELVEFLLSLIFALRRLMSFWSFWFWRNFICWIRGVQAFFTWSVIFVSMVSSSVLIFWASSLFFAINACFSFFS